MKLQVASFVFCWLSLAGILCHLFIGAIAFLYAAYASLCISFICYLFGYRQMQKKWMRLIDQLLDLRDLLEHIQLVNEQIRKLANEETMSK
jgi:hypothetical protein